MLLILLDNIRPEPDPHRMSLIKICDGPFGVEKVRRSVSTIVNITLNLSFWRRMPEGKFSADRHLIRRAKSIQRTTCSNTMNTCECGTCGHALTCESGFWIFNKLAEHPSPYETDENLPYERQQQQCTVPPMCVRLDLMPMRHRVITYDWR